MEKQTPKLLTLAQTADFLKKPGQTTQNCLDRIRYCMKKGYYRPPIFMADTYFVPEHELEDVRGALAAMEKRSETARKKRGLYKRDDSNGGGV